MSASEPSSGPKTATGIKGLDAILAGGLPRGELHLVQGDTGTGKTTIGLQFLLAGVATGEKALFTAFAQTEATLRRSRPRMAGRWTVWISRS